MSHFSSIYACSIFWKISFEISWWEFATSLNFRWFKNLNVSQVSLGIRRRRTTKIHSFHHFRWKPLQIESDIVHWAVNTWKNSHVYQLTSSHGFEFFPPVVHIRYRTQHVVNLATARWRAQCGGQAHAHERGINAKTAPVKAQMGDDNCDYETN